MSRNAFIAAVLSSAAERKVVLNQATAGKVVDAVLDSIRTQLKSYGVVSIHKFGTFRVVHRQARQGRNPKTGAPLKIPARHAVSFSSSSSLRKEANDFSLPAARGSDEAQAAKNKLVAAKHAAVAGIAALKAQPSSTKAVAAPRKRAVAAPRKRAVVAPKVAKRVVRPKTATKVTTKK